MAEQHVENESKKASAFETDLNDIGPCKKLLRVEYSAEQVKKEIDKSFGEIRQKAQIPGFRRGKAPRRHLERLFGDDVRARVRESLVYDSLKEFLDNEDLELLADPQPTDVKFSPDSGLSYEVTLVLRPSFEVPEAEGMKVEVPPVHIADEEIEKRLVDINRERGEWSEIGDEETVEEGDKVIADIEVWLASDLEAFEAQQEAEGDQESAEDEDDDDDEDDDTEDESGLRALAEHEDVELSISGDEVQMVAGIVVQGLADDLLGHQVGDVCDVDVVLPSDYDVMEGRDEPAILRIEIDSIERLRVPELSDELAKEHDCETLADLRAKIRDQLVEEKMREKDEAAGDEIVAEMLRRIGDLELPDDLVEQELNSKRQQHAIRCQTMGMSQEQMEKELLDKDDELRVEAMNSLKRFFVLDAVAKKEKIKVSESEVQSAVMQTAQMLAAQAPELVPQFIQDRNRIAEIRWSVLENKTLDHLREKVEIIEKG